MAQETHMQYFKSSLWGLTIKTEQRKKVGVDSGFRLIRRLCLEELQQIRKTRDGSLHRTQHTMLKPVFVIDGVI